MISGSQSGPDVVLHILTLGLCVFRQEQRGEKTRHLKTSPLHLDQRPKAQHQRPMQIKMDPNSHNPKHYSKAEFRIQRSFPNQCVDYANFPDQTGSSRTEGGYQLDEYFQLSPGFPQQNPSSPPVNAPFHNQAHNASFHG